MGFLPAVFPASLVLFATAAYGCDVSWECGASYDPKEQAGVEGLFYLTTTNAGDCYKACVADSKCNSATWGPTYNGCHLRTITDPGISPHRVVWQDTFRFKDDCRPSTPPNYPCTTACLEITWLCGAAYDPDLQSGVENVGYAKTADADACFKACVDNAECNTATWGKNYQGCHMRKIRDASIQPVPVNWQDTFRFNPACRPSSGNVPAFTCGAAPQQTQCGPVSWQCGAAYDPLKQSGVIEVEYLETADAAGCFQACRNDSACNTATWGPSYNGCHKRKITDPSIQPISVDWQDTFRFDGNCPRPSAPQGACNRATPNPTQNPPASWETMPEMPIALGEATAGVLPLNGKDYLVVIGESDAGRYPNENGLTAIYDFAQRTWTTGAKRPHIGNHHAAEVYEGKWYVIGGFGAEPRVQIGELFTNNGKTDIRWSVAGSSVPINVASAGSWRVGSKIYYCGGIKGTYTVSNCAIYDITSDSWSTNVPDLLAGRNHAANCAQPGGALLLIGGRSFGNELKPGYSDTQIFKNGQWSRGTPLPLARGGMGAGVYSNGKCYVFGGEFGSEITPSPELRVNSGRASYAVDIYDIASNSWSRGPDIPTGMHGTFAVKYGNAIHIAGGGTRAQFSQSKLHFRLNL